MLYHSKIVLSVLLLIAVAPLALLLRPIRAFEWYTVKFPAIVRCYWKTTVESL